MLIGQLILCLEGLIYGGVGSKLPQNHGGRVSFCVRSLFSEEEAIYNMKKTLNK